MNRHRSDSRELYALEMLGEIQMPGAFLKGLPQINCQEYEYRTTNGRRNIIYFSEIISFEVRHCFSLGSCPAIASVGKSITNIVSNLASI